MLVINKPINLKIDGLEYSVAWHDKKLSKELKEIIKQKITKKEVVVTHVDNEDYNYNKKRLFTSDEVIKNKIRAMITYNPDEKLLVIRDLTPFEADHLIKCTEELRPTLRENDKEIIVMYKMKKHQNLKNAISEVKGHLDYILREELSYHYDEIDDGYKEGWGYDDDGFSKPSHNF